MFDYKRLVITFARMQPPTVGHLKLLRSLASLAELLAADVKIFLSDKHDPKDNPFTNNCREKIVRQTWETLSCPRPTEISVSKIDVFNILKTQWLNNYQEIYVVVGEDQAEHLHHNIMKYHDQYFPSAFVTVISAGPRTDEGISSGSDIRKKMKEGKFDDVAKYCLLEDYLEV